MQPDSESDAPSDWEAEDIKDEEVETVPPKQVAPAVKPVKGGDYAIPAHLRTPLEDPDAERERIKLVQEHRDVALGGAMFGVAADDYDEELERRSRALLSKVNIPGSKAASSKGEVSLEQLTVARAQDVDALLAVLVPKITESPAKSPTWLRLLDRLLAACAPKMEPMDLATLQKKINQAVDTREREKNFAKTKSKKGTDLKVNLKDPRAELDIYDGLDDDDEEYDDAPANPAELDEYADYM